MSELTNARKDRGDFRRQLLMTVSSLALVSFVSVHEVEAANDDSDRPTVWIELGGQFDRADNAQTIFTPKFFDLSSTAALEAMTNSQKPPPYNIGGEGKISFAPEGTNWVFSAAVRYGRSNSAKHLHYETRGLPTVEETVSGAPFNQYKPQIREFGDGQVGQSATHFVMDFQAGKDVGLGLFGAGGSSIVSAGVRFAQFTSKTDVALHARPVNSLYAKLGFGRNSFYKFYHHRQRTYTAVLHAERNSQAIGPSLSWDASLPVAGSDNGMALAFDWGANAAVLFGRQSAKTHHQTEGDYRIGITFGTVVSSYAHAPPDQNRSRTVTIPNVGGFTGLSFRYANAKLDFGYRADFFFGAMDGGIDTARKENVGFFGPFATISVGLP